MNTDPPFDEAAEPDRLREFIAELERDGFEQVDEREWRGPIRASLVDGGHTDSEFMSVIVRPAWPYQPPLVHVPGITSWHADQERLCIWQAEDSSQRWATLWGIYDRIDEWAARAQDGFAVVENARNPEIYWQEEIGHVAGLVDLDDLLGADRADGQHGEFRFSDAVSADGRPSPVVVFDLHRGPFGPMTELPQCAGNHSVVRGRWFYRSVVPHPPRNLDELRSFLTDKQRNRLDNDLRQRPLLMYGLLWSNQAGVVGTMLLNARTDDGSDRSLVSLRPKGRHALLLRAGPDAGMLQEACVAIVGVGALGSHVADLLARAGIGRLRLLDFDRSWPANLIRHAAPPGTPAGVLKATAMKETLEQYPWVTVDVPERWEAGYVWTIGQIRGTLESADLTIDATGHGGLAELISRVAGELGHPFVSVALFRGGSVARVRRQACDDDVPVLQRPLLDPYPQIPPLDEEAEYIGTETGCLAQIHNAPPVAVAHAGALAAEVAIDYLSGRREQPDEVVEILRASDPPFHRLGRMRPEDLPITVDVSERAQQLVRDAARRALPNETGGILLGCTIAHRTIVAEAVEILDDHATPSQYRVPADSTGVAVSRARERDGRLGYVGEWHSHPSGAGPSPLDIATMISARDDSGHESPVLLLVHPSTGRPDELCAFATTAAGLRPAEICTTGDLPDEGPT
ncbi:MAG: ThiF family adenylyltransferase [Actinomycetota bacterium]|nr:ThiF family adenylyltransferase [Actinomycetota bacterium]